MTESQLDLSFDERTPGERRWQELLAELRRTVAMVGLKEAAFACNAKPDRLSHALAERDRHYLRAEWVQPILMLSPDLGLAKTLVRPAGLDVEHKEELSAEEKLERLEFVLESSLGPDMRRSIYDKAWRQK